MAEMAGNNGKCLDLAGNGLKWLEMAGVAGNLWRG